jgi:hypothetical protein
MKKLLLLASLLIVSLVQAQYSASTQAILNQVKQNDERKAKEQKEAEEKEAIFNHPNAEYIKSLNELNLDQSKKIVDEIVSLLSSRYELLKITELEQYGVLQFEYVPVGLTATEKEEYSFSITKHPLTIRFSIYYIGENKDLEIKGEKAFKLSEVKGKYLEVTPYWIKTFYPNATPETVLATYDLKTFYKREAHLKFMLQKNNEIWKLINVSN